MPKEIGGLKLFDVEELSKLLGVSVKTLNDYFRTERIKGRKLGRVWHTTEDNLKAFMNEKEEAAPEQTDPKVMEALRNMKTWPSDEDVK